MLATGIRTPVGIKVIGKNLGTMEKIARQIETVLETVPGTSSAYAERVLGGCYLDIVPNRSDLARYGLTISDVQDVVAMPLGPSPSRQLSRAASAIPWPFAYPRALRSDPQAIAKNVLLS